MEDYIYDTKCTVFIRAIIDGNETLSTCGPFKIGDKCKATCISITEDVDNGFYHTLIMSTKGIVDYNVYFTMYSCTGYLEEAYSIFGIPQQNLQKIM